MEVIPQEIHVRMLPYMLQVELCYDPIIQSGGDYQLKFSTVRYGWNCSLPVSHSITIHVDMFLLAATMNMCTLEQYCVLSGFGTNHTAQTSSEHYLWNRQR